MLVDILGVPTEGTRSLKDESGSVKFLEVHGKFYDLNIKNLTKKSLKGRFQLLFELVNKALLLRIEKRTTVTGLYLLLMEALPKLKCVNLPTIVTEHMHKVMMAKNGKHGSTYGF